MSETSKKLRDHVAKRGGPKLENGVWQLMLDAADEIEELELRKMVLDKLVQYDQELGLE